MKFFLPVNAMVLAAVVLATPAYAQSKAAKPKRGDGLIGVFGDWSAFANKVAGKLVCYAGGEPQKAAGKYKRRGATYILVSHSPADRSFGVVSLKAGYVYKAGSEVEITIGGFQQKLFTDAGRAWAYDGKADKALTRAMKNGTTLVAKGSSSRGTVTTDTYSLKGFTAADHAASKACGAK